MRLHIFGASGSGSTTLGKLFSRGFACQVIDADDYYWNKAVVPYTEKNSIEK